jgi:2-iminobutanoate/2-iminopropanoate deaminase
MSIERIFPAHAPTPRGPYSPVVRAGDFLYLSGQGPVDTVTDKLIGGDIQDQTTLVLSNIRKTLESCGASMADVVRCGVYLKNGGDFKAMNEVYAGFFGDARPARTTIVCEFAADMLIEVDCVAYKPV